METARSKALRKDSVPEAPPHASGTSHAEPDFHQPTPKQVREELDRILQYSGYFRSTRSKNFLKYITDQTLAGNSRRLKQYLIATEVLGRGSDFDPDTDPVVRLEATKLRRALDDYYLREGANDPVRISIPKGSYVPAFERIDPDAHGARDAAALRIDSHMVTSGVRQRLLILPFNVQTETQPCQALAHGSREQLIVELARYRDISVIAQPQSEDLLGASTDRILADKNMQAGFAMSGSVRQDDECIRLTVRLHELQAGSIIWIECFDFDASTNPRLQAEDKVARSIAGSIADYYGVIFHTLSLQSVYSVDRSWSVQDAILRHRYFARTLTERVYRVARADLEFGMAQAAYHPMIWAALAHTVFYGNVLGFDEDANWLTVVYRYAQRAFELDHKCAFGHVVMALHGLYQRQFSDVFATCDLILRDNPHAPSTLLSAGFFRALAGDWDTGIKMLTSTLPVLPHPPAWAHRVTFLNYYRQKNYAAALHEIDRYHAPENFTPALLRAAALAQLGRTNEATASIAEVLRICPRFTNIVDHYFRYLTSFDEISDHLKQGLRKAGLTL